MGEMGNISKTSVGVPEEKRARNLLADESDMSSLV
jgi:hypothetical protein